MGRLTDEPVMPEARAEPASAGMFEPAKSNSDRYLLSQRGYGPHQAILELVGPGLRVLDVGAATGRLAGQLRDLLNARVIAVERDPIACATMRANGLDVVEADISVADAFDSLSARDESFDCIICGDVLEHLVDPHRAIVGLIPLLRPGGHFVVSIPNIVSLRARWSLIRGHWEYAESGIFDKTHLRFFTPATAERLLSDAGLEVVKAIPVGPLTVRLGRTGVMLSRLLPGLLAAQMVFKARVSRR
jgi:2-polyprenyl-3-methyl-5-hydroxy-6-metoxy-1,4-benzoquinol methylase